MTTTRALLLAFCVAVLLSPVLWAQRGPATLPGISLAELAASDKVWEDDFETADTLAGWAWHTNQTWTETGGNADETNSSGIAVNQTTIGQATHWVCAQLGTTTLSGQDKVVVVLRFPDDTPSNADSYYMVRYNELATDTIDWCERTCTSVHCHITACDEIIDTTNEQIVAGNWLCADVTGTGASTVVNAYEMDTNPCDIGHANFASTAIFSIAFTSDPTAAVDTGNFGGIGAITTMVTDENPDFACAGTF